MNSLPFKDLEGSFALQKRGHFQLHSKIYFPFFSEQLSIICKIKYRRIILLQTPGKSECHRRSYIELTGNKCHQKCQIENHESIPKSALMLIQFVKRECNMDILNCDLTLETMLSLWRVVRFFQLTGACR